MFLLRPILLPAAGVLKVFTFQYVSIKTGEAKAGAGRQGHLHSNMFLLSHVKTVFMNLRNPDLHSNMFLLRRG